MENSERFWRRVFHNFFPFVDFNQQERLTAIRGPTQWSAHSRGCGPLDLDSLDLIAQPAVTRTGDLTAILFVAGRMFARDQAEKPGNLPHIGDQRWIA